MSESATLIVTAVAEAATLLQELLILGVPVIWWIVAFAILGVISRLVLFTVHTGAGMEIRSGIRRSKSSGSGSSRSKSGGGS